MDISDLDFSDAGDSSWTMYLDHSPSVSLHRLDDNNGETRQEHDEDSSMVSDASSGPPYYREETIPEDPTQQNTLYWCKNKNKKKVHKEQRCSEKFNSSLDDTASSLPVGEEFSAYKQHLDGYQRLDDFSRSYSTRRIFKGNFNSGFLQQDFPVEKVLLDNQGASNQKKRRGIKNEL
ncbi:PREDICTED: uncharacterized protein LOC104700832 [Camelina sativa]|uniref:Uncharacterized protein LOC104700832 n=1 Tax=Camelina sativa TaxID=90675 RepID=A0ABM0SQN3_CAMSA|nr:PREDICTED: uncharacterized protein LOC104700832 [Camelina sativa]